MLNKNGIYKLATRILAGALILFIGWFGNEVWSKQETTSQTNVEQDVSLGVLQEHIEAVDKTVQRIESCLIEDRIYRRQRDSILMDVAIKVNLMFDGR